MAQTPDEQRQSALQSLRARGTHATFCVVGAGHGGLAMESQLQRGTYVLPHFQGAFRPVCGVELGRTDERRPANLKSRRKT